MANYISEFVDKINIDLTFNCFHICGLFLFFAFHCKTQRKTLMLFWVTKGIYQRMDINFPTSASIKGRGKLSFC